MISIIVPIYKAEKYIQRCIESVLAQKYQDWELILVDDGSPDSSGKICDVYSSKDDRIRTIHKTNGGVGSARNVGLEKSHGDWICFIDADDTLEGDFFSCVCMYNADIFIQQSKHVNACGNSVPRGDSLPRMIIKTKCELRSFLRYYANSELIRSPWGKLFSREIIGGIRFDETMRIGEDTCFVFQVLFKNPRLVIPNQGYYVFTEDITSPIVKYTLSEEISYYSITRLFEEYDKLQARNLEIEQNFYELFSLLCTSGKTVHYFANFDEPLFRRIKQGREDWYSFKGRHIRRLLYNKLHYIESPSLLCCKIRALINKNKLR